jgi:PAS domain S-box-containing protein
MRAPETPCKTPCDAPVHILLVDDEPANLLALETILGDLGHALVRAPSGAEALARLSEQSFAVVLLDVQMLDMDGFETARRIRRQDVSRHTPIIFLTGYDENRDRVEEAYALGAVDYLVKPLVPIVLRAKVSGFVELFRKTEQLRQIEREHFERKLADENARFRALTEYSSDAVVLIDAGATVLYSSPSTRRVLGYEPNEFVGHSGFPFVHPDDAGYMRERLGHLLRHAETPVQVEMRVRHKDGSWRWTECVGTNLLSEPAVGAIVVNFRDITERHEAAAALRESERRFSSFMQHLNGLAWIKDLDGRYVFANDAALRVFGRTPEELYGRGDHALFDVPTAAQFKENDRRALSRSSGVQVVETLKHADGVVHHSLVTKFPMLGPNGKPAYIGGMAIDITERIEAETKLKEADRRKDEFLAMLAHELRNPLAPIRNSLYVLRRPDTSRDAAEQALTMVERQVYNMVRLVDDLLDVSRITRGKIQLRAEPIDLAAVLQRAVEATRPLIEANRHTLTLTLTPVPTRVVADPTRLEQVFANLLTNAAKYTERGGSIAVVTEREGPDVVVRVRDTGFGIPPAMLPHIFDLFTQGDCTLERAQGGLGIGLTLVKTLVEMHRGSVTAASAGPGHGSEFTVRLPACADVPSLTHAAAADPPDATAGDGSLHVLVVEDSRDAADSLAMLLQLWGHQVRVARDGLSGLKAARSFRPQVVFLDIGLPGLDGYEVARRLRAEFGDEVRLVAMTGYGQEEDRRRAREAGFDAHLVKPAEPELLQRLLADCAATQ